MYNKEQRKKQYKKELEKIKIFDAKESDILEFETFADSFMKNIERLDSENRVLTKIRDALMPKLISGQIELKNLSGKNPS